MSISSTINVYIRNDSRFNKGIHYFNSKQWYEAHDYLEDLWHELIGNERTTIQAMLQIAVAELHLERGNLKGATILYGEAVGRIQGDNIADLGKDLDSLCSVLKLRLQSLQNNQFPLDIDYPKIVDKN